jgi:dinuclear metal center YbgI/SA1388 family protein
MKIQQVIDFLEQKAPRVYQESYDNSGLLTGSSSDELTGILVCLDVIETVVDEAISNGCNFIVAHHPIIFSGLKRLSGNSYIERVIRKAIKNDIAIYAIHTNLDNQLHGVNAEIASRLGLINCRILQPKKGLLGKLITYCPVKHAEDVRMALFEAGAGRIGEYDLCSFNSEGMGTYRGSELSNPTLGEKGVLHRESETKIEVVFPLFIQERLIRALIEAHPYEEVAYDTVALENSHQQIGSGLIGELGNNISSDEFLAHLKKSMETEMIRHTLFDKEIKTVAICGGSGSFLLPDAIRQKADVFVTADFKYHQFFDAKDRLMICDIGHFESEKFTIDLLVRWLSENFPTFAVVFTKIVTNPVKYYS